MIDLKGLIGGGGLGLRVVSHTSGTIALGVTGDILAINAPSESSVVRLKILNSATGSIQSGISLTVDGNLIWDQLTLNDNGTPNNSQVSVRPYGTGDNLATVGFQIGVIYELYGKSITVNKNAGNTTQAINYAYEILEPIL